MPNGKFRDIFVASILRDEWPEIKERVFKGGNF